MDNAIKRQLFDHPKQFTAAGSELIARRVHGRSRHSGTSYLADTAMCTRQNRDAARQTGHGKPAT